MMLLHRSTMSCGDGPWPRLIAILLLTLLVPAPFAAGQGTIGTLPDPMSTRQLMQFADRLQLDASQRSAIESIHDEYKIEFRKLRDNEIDDFLDDTRSWGGMGAMPRREDMESSFNEMQRLQARIKRLDDRLFDQLLPTLTAEQLPLLGRVRLARERQRYRSNRMMAMTGRPPVDLSEVFLATDLPAEVRAEVDQVIAAYERHLTTAMRRASEAASRFSLDMFDAFQENGYGGKTEEDLSDPETMKQMMEDMKQIWSDIGSTSREAATRIAELNRRTYRRVAAFLPPEAAQDFRNRYYRAAFPELGGMLSMTRQQWFDWAIEHKDVSDEQREQLTATLALHAQKLDRLIENAVEFIEARRETMSPFDFDQEAMLEYLQQLQAVRKEAQQLMATTIGAANEIVPQITAAGVVENAQQRALALAGVDALLELDTGRDGDDRETDTADAEKNAGVRMHTPDGRIDQWILGPISRQEIARYAADLDLDDAALAQLRDLHVGYAQQFDSMGAIVELQKAGQSMRRYDPATGAVLRPEADALERIDQLRMKAIEQIALFDRSFFDDVEALVSDEHVPTIARLQARRLRQMYNVNGTMNFAFGFDQSAEGSLDLVELVEDRTLDDDALQRINSVLAAYEGPATDLFRKRFEAQLAFQQAMRVWSAAAQSLQGDPAEAMEYARRHQEIVGDASEKVNDTSRKVAELNRRTLEELVNTLPDAAGTSIRTAYERKAYPSIFKDPVSIERHLRAAFRLKDLTEQQREQLDLLAATYDPEYQRLSKAMVAQVGGHPMNPLNFEPGDWQEYQQKQEQMKRLRFDRDELCYRAINKLKASLSPEQIKRIGGLPAPRTPGQGSVIISR